MATSVPVRDDTPVLAVVDGFVLDCLLSDNHTFESEVTEFPVESGSTISDNIRPKPLMVVMEAVVSDTPLTFAGNFRSAGSVPSFDAYAKFLSIRRERRLVSITTSLDTYNNMALESLSVPRASGRGEEFRFNATFRQVEIVQNKRETRVAIPAAKLTTADYDNLFPKDDSIQYLDFNNKTWYDTRISGWRLDWWLETNLRNDFGKHNKNIGKYVLTDDAPLDIPDAKWRALKKQFGSDPPPPALIRSLVLAGQGGRPKPMMDGKDPRLVHAIRPGFYVFFIRVPASGKVNYTPPPGYGSGTKDI